jgi:hypothetical protein
MLCFEVLEATGNSTDDAPAGGGFTSQRVFLFKHATSRSSAWAMPTSVEEFIHLFIALPLHTSTPFLRSVQGYRFTCRLRQPPTLSRLSLPSYIKASSDVRHTRRVSRVPPLRRSCVSSTRRSSLPPRKCLALRPAGSQGGKVKAPSRTVSPGLVRTAPNPIFGERLFSPLFSFLCYKCRKARVVSSHINSSSSKTFRLTLIRRAPFLSLLPLPPHLSSAEFGRASQKMPQTRTQRGRKSLC